MDKKYLIDILYSDDSIDKKFLKLEQKIKYKHEFTDEEFEYMLLILDALIFKNSAQPNNYSDLLYLTPKFSSEQCLKLSELIKSEYFLFDIIMSRNITFKEYKNLEFKLSKNHLLSGLLYLETSPEEQDELFRMILGKDYNRNQEKKEDFFLKTVCFVSSASSIPHFYNNFFNFKKLAPVGIQNVYGGIPYNIKKANSLTTKGSFEKLKMYFPSGTFPSLHENIFTEIDLYLLNENPRLKKYIDNRIYPYSVSYSRFLSGREKQEEIFKRKTELFKLVDNKETICCESLAGIFPKNLGLEFNIPRKSSILNMDSCKLVRNTNYYDYFTGMNILAFKGLLSTSKKYFISSYDYSNHNGIFIDMLKEIYKSYGLQELVNVFETISKNPLSSFISINFEIFQELDEELMNNLDYLKVIAPFVFFNLAKIDGRYVYYDFLNLTEEQLKILNFIVIKD